MNQNKLKTQQIPPFHQIGPLDSIRLAVTSGAIVLNTSADPIKALRTYRNSCKSNLANKTSEQTKKDLKDTYVRYAEELIRIYCLQQDFNALTHGEFSDQDEAAVPDDILELLALEDVSSPSTESVQEGSDIPELISSSPQERSSFEILCETAQQNAESLAITTQKMEVLSGFHIAVPQMPQRVLESIQPTPEVDQPNTASMGTNKPPPHQMVETKGEHPVPPAPNVKQTKTHKTREKTRGLKYRHLVERLKKQGFFPTSRSKGSHRTWVNARRDKITLAAHGGSSVLKPKTAANIIKRTRG